MRSSGRASESICSPHSQRRPMRIAGRRGTPEDRRRRAVACSASVASAIARGGQACVDQEPPQPRRLRRGSRGPRGRSRRRTPAGSRPARTVRRRRSRRRTRRRAVHRDGAAGSRRARRAEAAARTAWRSRARSASGVELARRRAASMGTQSTSPSVRSTRSAVKYENGQAEIEEERRSRAAGRRPLRQSLPKHDQHRPFLPRNGPASQNWRSPIAVCRRPCNGHCFRLGSRQVFLRPRWWDVSRTAS